MVWSKLQQETPSCFKSWKGITGKEVCKIFYNLENRSFLTVGWLGYGNLKDFPDKEKESI